MAPEEIIKIKEIPLNGSLIKTEHVDGTGIYCYLWEIGFKRRFWDQLRIESSIFHMSQGNGTPCLKEYVGMYIKLFGTKERRWGI